MAQYTIRGITWGNKRGGLRAIAVILASRAILVAPRNPSGPVATLATLAAASGLPDMLIGLGGTFDDRLAAAHPPASGRPTRCPAAAVRPLWQTACRIG